METWADCRLAFAGNVESKMREVWDVRGGGLGCYRICGQEDCVNGGTWSDVGVPTGWWSTFALLSEKGAVPSGFAPSSLSLFRV